MIYSPVRLYFYLIFLRFLDDYGRPWTTFDVGEWWDGWDSNPGPKP